MDGGYAASICPTLQVGPGRNSITSLLWLLGTPILAVSDLSGLASIGE